MRPRKDMLHSSKRRRSGHIFGGKHERSSKLIIYVIILAVATVMWPRLSVFADEDFTSNYNQRTFSDTDGFDSG